MWHSQCDYINDKLVILTSRTHLYGFCTFACKLISCYEPSDWAFLSFARLRRQGGHEAVGGPVEMETIVSSSPSLYLCTLPLICGDRSFVWCQRDHQRATGHNAVASESRWCVHCWTLKGGFELFFPTNFNSVYHLYQTPIWILMTIS